MHPLYVYVLTFAEEMPFVVHVCKHTFNVVGSIAVSKKKSTINQHQELILQRAFAVLRYPNKTTLKNLALQTGLQKAQVSIWFRRKRYATKCGKSEEHYHFESIYMYIHLC